MKAVILTSGAGRGQIASAAALCRALTARGAVCEVRSARSFFGPGTAETTLDALSGAPAELPRAFAFLAAGESFPRANKRKSTIYQANALYAEALHTYLTGREIDAAICMGLFTAEAVTSLRSMRGLSARAYHISSYYACVPFLEETRMDAYFIPKPELAGRFTSRGIPNDRVFAAGVPVLGSFAESVEQADARALLDLPQKPPQYLIMGLDDPEPLILALLSRLRGADARILAFTGENEALERALTARFASELRVLPVSYSDRVPLYMDACDVLLTRPGGVTSTEAAVKGVPLVHTAPRSQAERETALYFAQTDMALCAFDPAEAAAAAVQLAGDAAARKALIGAQRSEIDTSAAERIARHILAGRPVSE